MRLFLGLLVLGCIAARPALARAQDADPAGQAAAARAYDQGVSAFLNGDHARAAVWFETAYRLAPAPAAIIQAALAHQEAGALARAASLAHWMRERHADDPQVAETSEAILSAHEGGLVEITVDCQDCVVAVDGEVWAHDTVFVSPNEAHQVVLQSGDARRGYDIEEPPGARRTLEGPDPSEVPASTATATAIAPDAIDPGYAQADPDANATTPDAGSSGFGFVDPWAFAVALGVTAVAGAVLIWSGVDALSGLSDYEANPTWEGFREGEDRELRTNVLIGITAGAAAVTAVLALLTDWDGSSRGGSDAEVSLRVSPFGADLVGHF